jgi:hypothetical protein
VESTLQPAQTLSQGGIPKNEQFLGRQQGARKFLVKPLLSIQKTRLFSMSRKPYRFYLFGTIVEVL